MDLGSEGAREGRRDPRGLPRREGAREARRDLSGTVIRRTSRSSWTWDLEERVKGAEIFVDLGSEGVREGRRDPRGPPRREGAREGRRDLRGPGIRRTPRSSWARDLKECAKDAEIFMDLGSGVAREGRRDPRGLPRNEGAREGRRDLRGPGIRRTPRSSWTWDLKERAKDAEIFVDLGSEGAREGRRRAGRHQLQLYHQHLRVGRAARAGPAAA